MARRYYFLGLAALLVLSVNGLVHGLLTQRWSGLTEAQVEAATDRLPDIPCQLPSWTGQKIELESAKMPEDVVGKNVTVKYEHRITHQTVLIYLACGHKTTLVLHTPTDCYPSHGFTTVRQKTPVALPLESGASTANVFVATFSQTDASVANHLRVFWTWKPASGGWQAPDNPFRTFRASPYLYKCYAIRSVPTPDEPLEGDPCVSLLTELLPRLDGVLLHDR